MNTSISTRFQGVKRAEVAGLFYPEDAGTLSRIVDLALSEARERVSPSPSPPKAIFSPHAGYPYSAPVAGSAYAHLESGRNKLQRVIVIGPAHRFGFRGMALCSAEEFETPLGRIPADTSALERVLDLPSVQVLNQAYQREHSLETQFPFLQTLLCDFQVVPIIVGQCDPVFVAQVLDALWGGPETCFVISSDLSHFLTDTDARRMDSQTSNLIETGRGDQLTSRHACGFLPIQGLLQ
ncbi:MAG: AmmeMemoRadiSam system protein B, partial [Planctomycetaceae bacterium]|nr:AmmeMemoRadiSam system protein B [Planctomycetaceae bacterium]